MLLDAVHEVLEAVFSNENLSFSVDHVFLQVESSCFADAEVLHGVGHLVAQIRRQAEKMIHCISTGQDDGRVLG